MKARTSRQVLQRSHAARNFVSKLIVRSPSGGSTHERCGHCGLPLAALECRSITLYSNDWRACRRFYVDFLGLGMVAEGEDQFLALQGSPLCIDAAHGRPPAAGSYCS